MSEQSSTEMDVAICSVEMSFVLARPGSFLDPSVEDCFFLFSMFILYVDVSRKHDILIFSSFTPLICEI